MKQIRTLFRGKTADCLAGALVVSYLAVALWPFSWKPPQRIPNGAAIQRDGTVRFERPGMIYGLRPPTWMSRPETIHDLKVSLRVRAFRDVQSGPARIFTLSRDHFACNFTLAQEDSDLVLRLRVTADAPDGLPPRVIQNVFPSSEWRTIELSLRGCQLEMSVDESIAISERLRVEPMHVWDPSHQLSAR